VERKAAAGRRWAEWCGIDDGRIQAHLDEVVRSTVEEALNALLDAEADHLCGARKYERTEGRKDTRAGSSTRQLHTKAGEVSLQVPKLRSLPLRRRSSSATGGASRRWKRR
jgi:transposase-like protein